MKQLVNLLLGCVACILFACDYSPSGAHFKEVNPDVPVVADIALDQQQDTIVVRGNLRLNYNIWLPGRTLYGYQLKLGNVVLEQGNRPTGSHLLISDKYQDGYHLLKLEALSNSGTGSLADRNKAEVLEIYRTWVVYIHNAPPAPVAITSIKPVDGRLKLEWEKAKRPGFRQYEVVRVEGFSNTVLTSFTSPDSTSWSDPDYVGGPVTYRIVLRSIDQSYSGVVGPSRSYEYPLPHVLEATYNDAYDLTIKFSSTPFYRNFSRYELRISEAPFNIPLSLSSHTRTDTVVTMVSAVLGTDYKVTLITHLKSKEHLMHHDGLAAETTVKGFGTPWGPYNNLTRRPQANLFYQLGWSEFKLIDAGTLQAKQSRLFSYEQAFASVALSEDTRYMYALSKNGEIQKLNSTTFQAVQTYKLADLLPQGGFTFFSLNGVSDNNRLLVVAKGVQQRDSLFLVDMEARKIVMKHRADIYQGSAYALVHPAGKAIVTSFELLYEQSNGSWQEQRIPDNHYYDMKFHPAEPWFYVKQDGQLKFYHIETAAPVKTIPLETDLSSYAIDAATGYLYGIGRGSTQGMFYVYDPGTAQLKRKLQVRDPSSTFVYKDKIFNADRYIPL